jgi:hypothetical protein
MRRRYHKPSKLEQRLGDLYLKGCVLPRIFVISIAFGLAVVFVVVYEGFLLIQYLVSLFR